MKNIKTIILLLSLSTGIFLSSCNDWLDVLSNEEILEEDAFATTKGFRAALVGAYEIAASPNFYGKELTWGMLSALSQNYNKSNLGNVAAYSNLLKNENFENSYTKTVIDNIWKTGYNVIANCNNLIQNIEKTDKPFQYPWEKGMILAEAKALRALVHFDLLRLFAKAPVLGNTAKAIPYVTNYPNVAPEYKSTQEIITAIVKDLEYAREILRPVDVDILWGESIMDSYFTTMIFSGIQNLLDDGKRGNGDVGGFFCMRGYRMNYWAVTALLGRVHSYNRDNETAMKYVNEVIFDWYESGVGYDFAWYGEPNTNPNNVDGKRVPEPLVMFWNTKVGENYATLAGTNYFKMNTLDALFGGEKSQDWRYTAFYNTSSKQYLVWKDIDDMQAASNNYVKKGVSSCPVLELPEMFYIKAEYFAEKNMFDSAAIALNKVRFARNLNAALPQVSSTEEFMELLVNDLTRDFLTRGQTWFYLKKLNYKKMYNGNPVWWDVPEEWYVLPIPDSETMY